MTFRAFPVHKYDHVNLHGTIRCGLNTERAADGYREGVSTEKRCERGTSNRPLRKIVFSEFSKLGVGLASDKETRSLKVITAFVSGAGVSAIAPLLDVFLADGNSADIIFGVDRNGTDREAVKQLFRSKASVYQADRCPSFSCSQRGGAFSSSQALYL